MRVVSTILPALFALDLEQDLGLTGAYTFSITNPVLSKQAAGP